MESSIARWLHETGKLVNYPTLHLIITQTGSLFRAMIDEASFSPRSVRSRDFTMPFQLRQMALNAIG